MIYVLEIKHMYFIVKYTIVIQCLWCKNRLASSEYEKYISMIPKRKFIWPEMN